MEGLGGWYVPKMIERLERERERERERDSKLCCQWKQSSISNLCDGLKVTVVNHEIWPGCSFQFCTLCRGCSSINVAVGESRGGHKKKNLNDQYKS